MNALSEAVALSTSRMLHLLERHDPGTSRYLGALSGALARVAFADGEFATAERDTLASLGAALNACAAPASPPGSAPRLG